MLPRQLRRRAGTMPPSNSSHTTSSHATTSFLIANLHCPSCVSSIKAAIQEACGDEVLWVSPNVVTSVVTVEHYDTPTANDTISTMGKSLEEIGFDISDVTTTITTKDNSALERVAQIDPGERSCDIVTSGGALDGWSFLRRSKSAPRVRTSKKQAHLESCAQCRNAKKSGNDSTAGPTSELGMSRQDVDLETQKVKEMPSFTTTLVSVQATSTSPTWRASLAVGGMTCAVCVNAITEELNKRPWISNVVVNLVSNSATVDFIDEGQAAKIVEIIEDLGYEATLDNVVCLGQEKDNFEERTVEILIEGIFCRDCPDRLDHTLSGFRRRIDIESKPTLERPILKITYIPEAPQFTIRHILSAIEATDDAFRASIYHPPTLEERGKLIRAKHQRQLLVRVIFTLIVAIPTFIIGIVYMSLVSSDDPGRMLLMNPWKSGISRGQIALFAMSTPVYFFGADIFHIRAVKEIRNMWRPGSRTPLLQRFYKFGSMNMLMSLGTTIAYVSSVSQMIAAAVENSDEVQNSSFYFDSVVFLTLFLLTGRLIESYSKSKTGDAVELLGKLRPTTAILVEGDDSEKAHDKVVNVDVLEFGDIVRVTHGASPPSDSVIVQGATSFDESSLTGESRLIKKSEGDEIFAGTVNKDSPVLARITGVAGTSMLDQIVNVVREGQTKRAPMEQLADILTTYFVPIVTLIAVTTWVVWMALGVSGAIPADYLDTPTAGGWVAFALQFAIAVFVVSCPCGLGLAAPTAIFVGGGVAAKHGILAKGGGEAFEKASKVDCVVFDKTGTLTTGGEPKITDAVIYPDFQTVDEEKANSMLAALKAVEENSSHPIAKAIVGYCSPKTTRQVNIENLQEIPGKGMKASYGAPASAEASDIIVGSEKLMRDFSVPISERVAALLQTWKSEAKSIALAATRPRSAEQGEAWTLAAALSISDPIRPEAAAIIRALRSKGTRVWMLSGDNEVTARAVAKKVGIDPSNVFAEVLPSQKAEKITYLQSILKARVGRTGESASRRALVAMVGDGINDSPALTVADVGIAIGSGSDVAISSADFVLVTSDLRAVVTLIELSRVVFRRIKFNFGWALVYNLIAVPVAGGCLYPIQAPGGHVRLDPVWASLAMAMSSISVVTSSLALKSRLPVIGFRATEVRVDEPVAKLKTEDKPEVETVEKVIGKEYLGLPALPPLGLDDFLNDLPKAP